MKNKHDTTTFAIAAAATIAAGIATYMLVKTYKTIQKLEELELDFGNDSGILSMFKREDDK